MLCCEWSYVFVRRHCSIRTHECYINIYAIAPRRCQLHVRSASVAGGVGRPVAASLNTQAPAPNQTFPSNEVGRAMELKAECSVVNMLLGRAIGDRLHALRRFMSTDPSAILIKREAQERLQSAVALLGTATSDRGGSLSGWHNRGWA